MTILTSERAIQAIQHTPPILKAVISSLSAEDAKQHRNGAEGWSVTEIVCHMRDYEAIVQQRIRLMLAQSVPDLPALDNEASALRGEYDLQDVHEVLEHFVGARFLTYQMLFPLPESLWQRRGVHPQFGEISLIEVVINAALHDVAHIEQITRALA